MLYVLLLRGDAKLINKFFFVEKKKKKLIRHDVDDKMNMMKWKIFSFIFSIKYSVCYLKTKALMKSFQSNFTLSFAFEKVNLTLQRIYLLTRDNVLWSCSHIYANNFRRMHQFSMNNKFTDMIRLCKHTLVFTLKSTVYVDII